MANQQPPAVPPRPSKLAEKNSDGQVLETPSIPPRPGRSRPTSALVDRYAPSPLNEDLHHARTPSGKPSLDSKRDSLDHLGSNFSNEHLGQEGNEYAAMTDDLQDDHISLSASPTETRTVGQDVTLHAPKPSLPASSAKQQVKALTRTDSSQAASFGIGRVTDAPSISNTNITSESNDSSNIGGIGGGEGIARVMSISSQASSDHHGHGHSHPDEIPEIGVQVPMLRYAGDVQAPTPSISTDPLARSGRSGRAETDSKSGQDRASSRGPPPGSYGMHGHGVLPDDKLDQAYYQKHPESYKHENLVQLHERKHDFNMSSEDLNHLVKSSAARESGLGGCDPCLWSPYER